MSKFPATDAPDELVRFAEAQLAGEGVTSREQVVRASVESVKERNGPHGYFYDKIIEEMRT